MKPKARTRPRFTIADAVYKAINQLDGAPDKQVMARASKLCGKTVTRERFDRAIKSFYDRGLG